MAGVVEETCTRKGVVDNALVEEVVETYTCKAPWVVVGSRPVEEEVVTCSSRGVVGTP